MKKYITISLILLFSCTNQKHKSESLRMDFKQIPYSTSYNYRDSIAKKIKPIKPYNYWQYASFYSSGTIRTYKILAEGGNLSLRNQINTNVDFLKITGLFEGGHPNFRSNYLVVIDNGKVSYLESMEQLRDFIGEVDNLEEALLIAESLGCRLGSIPTTRLYNYSNGTYKLRLAKFSDSYLMSRYKGEMIELSITKDGFIKTNSLAVYCKGQDCWH